MVRKKMKVGFTENDAARRSAYIKRKKVLLKKVTKLSIVCGVDACAIINGCPYDHKPEVWPSPQMAKHVVTRFNNIPEIEKNNEMVDMHISYLEERVAELKKQVLKKEAQNRDLEITTLMFKALNTGGLEAVKPEGVNDLVRVIEKHGKDIKRQIKSLKRRAEIEVGEMVEDVVPRESLFMERLMNPPAGQQPPPLPPNGYYPGDGSMMLPVGGYNGFYGTPNGFHP
uniref:MADS-box protein AGL81 n=1 Tax=Aquilegia coerulea TaxID=218851 RepID=K7X6Q1_AQUCA|nr:MADS-box protein AGL81 [Aquilegia coerulea]